MLSFEQCIIETQNNTMVKIMFFGHGENEPAFSIEFFVKNTTSSNTVISAKM